MSAYSYILFCVPLFPSDLSALFKKTDSTLVVFDLPLQFFLFLLKMLCSHVRVFTRHFRIHSGTQEPSVSLFHYADYFILLFFFASLFWTFICSSYTCPVIFVRISSCMLQWMSFGLCPSYYLYGRHSCYCAYVLFPLVNSYIYKLLQNTDSSGCVYTTWWAKPTQPTETSVFFCHGQWHSHQTFGILCLFFFSFILVILFTQY